MHDTAPIHPELGWAATASVAALLGPPPTLRLIDSRRSAPIGADSARTRSPSGFASWLLAADHRRTDRWRWWREMVSSPWAFAAIMEAVRTHG